MKRKFRVISAHDDQRCVSYSTYEKAVEGLKKMAAKNGDTYGFSLLGAYKPEDYDWYNGYHPVKIWYHFVACNQDISILPQKYWPCYVIVEFN